MRGFCKWVGVFRGAKVELATENKKGIADRQEWFPAQIDPQ